MVADHSWGVTRCRFPQGAAASAALAAGGVVPARPSTPSWTPRLDEARRPCWPFYRAPEFEPWTRLNQERWRNGAPNLIDADQWRR